MKQCSKCKRILETYLFYSDKTHKDGVQSRCKECICKERKRVRLEYSKERKALEVIKAHDRYLAKREERRAANKKYRERNADIIKARRKSYWAANREKCLERQREYRSQNREKIFAQNLVKKAIYNGKIVRAKTCSDCGKKTKTEAHHEDYDKPLSVIWLCKSCHMCLHSKRRG